MSREEVKGAENANNDHHASSAPDDGSETKSTHNSHAFLGDDSGTDDVQSLSDTDHSDGDVLDALRISKAAPKTKHANKATASSIPDFETHDQNKTQDVENISTKSIVNNNKDTTRAKHRQIVIHATLLVLSILSFPAFLFCLVGSFFGLIDLLYKLWILVRRTNHGVQQVLWFFLLIDWSSPVLQFFILWALFSAWVWFHLRRWVPTLDRMLTKLY